MTSSGTDLQFSSVAAVRRLLLSTIKLLYNELQGSVEGSSLGERYRGKLPYSEVRYKEVLAKKENSGKVRSRGMFVIAGVCYREV